MVQVYVQRITQCICSINELYARLHLHPKRCIWWNEERAVDTYVGYRTQHKYADEEVKKIILEAIADGLVVKTDCKCIYCIYIGYRVVGAGSQMYKA